MVRTLAPALALLLLVSMAALRPAPSPATVTAAPLSASSTEQLSKVASASHAAPGDAVTYTLTITNYATLPDTFTLTDTLPAGLTIDPASITGGATYDAATRQVRWQGVIAGGPATYEITDSRSGGRSFPFKDISANPFNQMACTTDCDDTIISGPDLGGRSVDFYNVPVTDWRVSSNGYIQLPSPAPVDVGAKPVPIPSAAVPNGIFAGLWTDLDLDGSAPGDSGGGSWYSAVISGVDQVRPEDVFMVFQWKNAQQWLRPTSTLNFEIIARTGRRGEFCAVYGSPLVGNFVDGGNDGGGGPSGIAVGIENGDGSAGSQAYYSKGVGTTVGTPPEAGTTICAVPSPAAKKTITYRATANSPGTFTNTATARAAGAGSLGTVSATVTFGDATPTPTNTPTGTLPTVTSTPTATNTPTGTLPTATSIATSTTTGTPTRSVVRLPVVAR